VPFRDAHRDNAWERADLRPRQGEPPPGRQQALRNARRCQALSWVQPVERPLAPQGLLAMQLDASAGARLRRVE